MLKQRIITAVALAAIVLWALFGWSDFGFSLLLVVAAFACAWEWADLGHMQRTIPKVLFSAAVAAVAFILMRLSTPDIMRPIILVAVLLWIGILLDLYVRPVIKADGSKVNWLLLTAAIYIVLASVTSLYWFRGQLSSVFIVYLVALVAAADIGAYFAGRKFGHRKLAVNISQGKTIEGALGGFAAALVIAIAGVIYFSELATSSVTLFLFSVVAAVFSIAGDLFISRAKRSRGVKDSGMLLPGHGGVLDRFDGLLAAIPWMAFAVLWA